MVVVWVILWALFVSFLLIVFRGAPFVPTLRRDIEALFSLYDFQPDEVFVDLGSGDGRVLEAAAKRGIHAVGYELNPFLVGASLLRLMPYRALARVRMADFWRTPLPERTAVVFVFLAGPFMHKLDRHLQRQATHLGHDLILISYGVQIIGKTPENQQGGFRLYRYKA